MLIASVRSRISAPSSMLRFWAASVRLAEEHLVVGDERLGVEDAAGAFRF